MAVFAVMCKMHGDDSEQIWDLYATREAAQIAATALKGVVDGQFWVEAKSVFTKPKIPVDKG